MTKIVQVRRGTSTQISGVVFASGELAVDTSNWDLVIGDGTTEGGRRVLSEANASEKFQAKSAELSGLAGFQPQQKGLLVRLGPASYALRALVGSGSITVTNPRGQAGNVAVTLAANVTTAHTWSGVQTFDEAIEAEGGVNGNLTGDSTGTHTGDVVGNVTGNLTGDSTGTHTGPQIGPVDVTGEEFLADAGSIPLAYLGADAIQYILDAGVPPGTITLWYGSLVSIPNGWFLCDGDNGTPDLRDRFVLGAGGSVPVDAVGGSSTHTHSVTVDNGGSHAHTGTVANHTLTEAQIPSHRHLNGVTDSGTAVFNRGTVAASPTSPDSIDNNANTGSIEGYTSNTGGGGAHNHGLTIDAGGTHSHAASSGSASTIPPYLALAYIMKGL